MPITLQVQASTIAPQHNSPYGQARHRTTTHHKAKVSGQRRSCTIDLRPVSRHTTLPTILKRETGRRISRITLRLLHDLDSTSSRTATRSTSRILHPTNQATLRTTHKVGHRSSNVLTTNKRLLRRPTHNVHRHPCTAAITRPRKSGRIRHKYRHKANTTSSVKDILHLCPDPRIRTTIVRLLLLLGHSSMRAADISNLHAWLQQRVRVSRHRDKAPARRSRMLRQRRNGRLMGRHLRLQRC